MSPRADPQPDPIFRWGQLDALRGVLLTDDDTIEILRDTGGVQLSRIAINPSRGAGAIEYFWDETMRVLVMHGSFHQGLSYRIADDGWIRLNFSLSIEIDMALDENISVHEAEPSWRLFRLPPGAVAREIVPAAAPVQWVTICCSPQRLAQIAGLHVDDLPFGVAGAGSDGDALIYRPYRFTRAVKSATAEMFDRRPAGALRAAHIGAKASELIVYALDYLLNEESAAGLQLRLTQRDIRALDAARDYLDRHLAETPTISLLSRTVGINRNKLFYGFKSQFGRTVSEYLADVRLDESMRLLRETDRSVAWIATAVGFRHQCNFSTAFKRRFGISPRTLRSEGLTHSTTMAIHPSP